MLSQVTTNSMTSVLKQVQRVCAQAIKLAVDIDYNEEFVTPLPNNVNHDYQVMAAVKLFNKFKKSHNSFGFSSPQALGLHLISKLPENEVIESLEVNEAGFMFAKIKAEYLENSIAKIGQLGVIYKANEKKVVAMDFSSPNIAKEMHVGHLRTTIMGESMSRIQEFLGHKVYRINHLGDWGTPFGMLICQLKETHPEFPNKLVSLAELTNVYKAGGKKFKEDPEFKKQAQETVVKLQGGDVDCIKAWKALCGITMEENYKIYKMLDVTLEECPESFYNPMLPSIVKELEEKGLVQLVYGTKSKKLEQDEELEQKPVLVNSKPKQEKEEDEETKDSAELNKNPAKCVFLPKKTFPLIIQKSDGGYNYDTTDLAAAKYRITQLKANRLIYLTDLGQQPHFDLIFAAAEAAGWHKPPETSMEHMGFGQILGPDGTKLKSREGDAPTLKSLLEGGKEYALKQLETRFHENKEGQMTNLEKDEMEVAAEKMAIAAIKYYDLKQAKNSNYKFDYEKMFDAAGNTSVYLLYSYARLCSVIKKSDVSQEDLQEIAKNGFKFTNPQEKVLAMSVLRFAEVLDVVDKELAIHKLCDFIYDLACKIAVSYHVYKINDPKDKKSRVFLIDIVRKVMKQTFDLIGIQPLEKI